MSSGCGRAASVLFAQEDAKAVVVDYNGKAADKTVEMILTIKADVSQEAEVKNIIDRAAAAFAQIDVLFNNATFILTATWKRSH